MHVVWLKRDLRIDDHAPLWEASRLCAQGGRMVALYVYEPEVWWAADADASQLAFVDESLDALEPLLAARGGRLVRRVGEMTEVLGELSRCEAVESILAHEETGNGVTYMRDLRVARWCRRHSVPLRVWRQHGVFRPTVDRDGWAE
ncbi:MAG: deoxyribodipyrimidine photo-lyase, partial [Phycisphaerales bacterium]